MPAFVRNVAPVVEGLLEHARALETAAERAHSGGARGAVFAADGEWRRLGAAKRDGVSFRKGG